MRWFKKDKSSKAGPNTPTPGGMPEGGRSGMDQMVRMMAKAPEDQRSSMLGDRVAVFAGQDQSTRERGMKSMLVAALELPKDDYQKIAASRFKAMSALAAETQMSLMKSHAAVVKSLPADQQQKEMKAMKQIVSSLPEDKRVQVVSMMENLGLMGGNA